VLLPTSVLLRRADTAVVIGAALTAKAAGHGHRPIAVVVGRAASTVRGWLRAFAGNAEWIRVVCTALLLELDPVAGPLAPATTAFADAVQAIGSVAAAARRRLSVRGVAVAAGVGGHRRSAAGTGRPYRVDQHRLALGSGPLIGEGRDSCVNRARGGADGYWPRQGKTKYGPIGLKR
jgi:hypothetical protein